MKTALLLYPHQLFPLSDLPQIDTVIMIEDPLFFGVDQEFPTQLHKQKIILHRASMRRYVKEVLWPNDIDVDYIESGGLTITNEIFDRTKKYQKLVVFDPVHEVLTRRLLEARREVNDAPELEFLPSPNFFLKDQEAREYFHQKHDAVFGDFYKWQRERFNVLISEDYKPVGNAWQHQGHASKLAPKQSLPTFQVYGDNEYVSDAIRYCEERFSNNPGSTDFVWPTNHAEAEAWLHDFVMTRLPQYAAYKETLDDQAQWLYHSALSSSLNIGLLQPGQVLDTVLEHYRKHDLPLESVEVFVRQILGWREFMRGFYVTKHTSLRQNNPFKQHRKLAPGWLSGELGIPPYDDVVKKVQTHAYAHQTERLTIIYNLMVLAEIHPDEIYRFFSQMFIDASEWIVLPSTYGIIANIDGKSMLKNSIIAPSSRILELSNYERGEWSDVWDGLYWRFVEKHKGLLLHNPNTRSAAQRLERLDADHRRIIGYRAEDFLNTHTIL